MINVAKHLEDFNSEQRNLQNLDFKILTKACNFLISFCYLSRAFYHWVRSFSYDKRASKFGLTKFEINQLIREESWVFR